MDVNKSLRGDLQLIRKKIAHFKDEGSCNKRIVNHNCFYWASTRPSLFCLSLPCHKAVSLHDNYLVKSWLVLEHRLKITQKLYPVIVKWNNVRKWLLLIYNYRTISLEVPLSFFCVILTMLVSTNSIVSCVFLSIVSRLRYVFSSVT